MAHDVQTSRGRTTPTRTIKAPVKALASKAAPKAPAKPKAKPALVAPAHDPLAVSVANLIRTLSSDQIYDLVAELFPDAPEDFYEDVADSLVANVVSARNEPTISHEALVRKLGLDAELKAISDER
jgi:hypothetical protein